MAHRTVKGFIQAMSPGSETVLSIGRELVAFHPACHSTSDYEGEHSQQT